MSFESDKAWSDKFIPAITQIVGPRLLAPSTLEVDQTQAVDLVVLKAHSMTIACRVRDNEYADDYPKEFTIRCERDSGAKTELEKITEGWGDWMFYGIANKSETGFIIWHLLDLDAWRKHIAMPNGKIRRGTKSNGDGTKFDFFGIESFKGEPMLVIDSTDIEFAKL